MTWISQWTVRQRFGFNSKFKLTFYLKLLMMKILSLSLSLWSKTKLSWPTHYFHLLLFCNYRIMFRVTSSLIKRTPNCLLEMRNFFSQWQMLGVNIWLWTSWTIQKLIQKKMWRIEMTGIVVRNLMTWVVECGVLLVESK